MTSLQKLTYCIIFLTFTASCNKKETSIVGNWRATSFLLENCDDPAENKFILLSGFKCEHSNQYCYQSNVIFNDDNTFSFERLTVINYVEDLESLDGTYSISDEDIQLCLDTCIDFKIEDDDITYTFNSKTTGCDVTWRYFME